MNILVVTQYYYPEQFRVNDICEELVKRNHSVTVLTGKPNYPDGEIYPGYKGDEHKDEFINGVRVIRCNLIPRKKGILHLAINYFSYAWNASLCGKKLDENFDLVFVYQMSPVSMAIPAISIKKRKKIPLILYCCDLWPASILDTSIKRNSFAYNLVKRLSSYIYNSCNEIIVTSPSFKQYLKNECEVLNENMSYIPQHAETLYSSDLTAVDNGVVDFMFLGNIGLSQNCDCIIEAVRKLKTELPFKVHFVGAGSMLDEMKNLVQKYNLTDKIEFHGFQNMDKLPDFYRIADVCLLTLAYENEVGLTIPAKLQGYMAAGKPVVAAICGDAAKVIEESNCGYQVEAGNSTALASIMKNVIEHPELLPQLGNNGKMYFNNHFTKKIVVDQLEQHMKKVII